MSSDTTSSTRTNIPRAPKRTNIDSKNPGYREQYGVIVICDSEAQQRAIYERLHADGLRLRVVTT